MKVDKSKLAEILNVSNRGLRHIIEKEQLENKSKEWNRKREDGVNDE